MTKDELKNKIIATIDRYKKSIVEVGEALYNNPELGYREKHGTESVATFLEGLGYKVERNIAVTGVKAERPDKVSGPTVALLGELDAIVVRDHPDADPDTGAVHACGHHIQIAVMAGVALALQKSGAFKYLGGNVIFMATPAEEFVEMAFRSELKNEGKINYFGGKQEMVERGLFDAIDISMMMHSMDLGKGKQALVGPSGNGFIGKKIRFQGKESHAGLAPEHGINALNAAMLAINNIHAQRETFPDRDRIRVHPIITKGGDIVNVVPAEVTMECFVRARSVEAMVSANQKVNRAVKAGAMAVGAGVEIEDLPGYLPLLNTPALDTLFKNNATRFCGEETVTRGGDFTGSFDFGDISHIMPALHPFTGGVQGSLHTREFQMTDPETACLMPAKALSMTLVDLLWDNAKEAGEILDSFKPAMTKEQYLRFLKNTENKDFYSF